MATFTQLPSGNWRAMIRRKGHVLSEIDNGKTPTKKNVDGIKTFKGLIALHISDMKEVGKKIGRSKEYSLKLIERHLGEVRLDKLDREHIIRAPRTPRRTNSGNICRVMPPNTRRRATVLASVWLAPMMLRAHYQRIMTKMARKF